MRPAALTCGVVALAIAGCGGDTEEVARPAKGAPDAMRLTVGDARTTIPADWRLASEAVQDTLEQRLGRLPSADATGWEPKAPDGAATTLVVSVVDPGKLGAKGTFDPDDTEANVRDIIEGARDAFEEQEVDGARFTVRDPTTLGGTPAVVFDTSVPYPDRGRVLVHTLVSGRGTRIYSVQVDGPADDGPRMRSVVERVRRAWSWR